MSGGVPICLQSAAAHLPDAPAAPMAPPRIAVLRPPLRNVAMPAPLDPSVFHAELQPPPSAEVNANAPWSADPSFDGYSYQQSYAQPQQPQPQQPPYPQQPYAYPPQYARVAATLWGAAQFARPQDFPPVDPSA